jgi:ATP-dependent Clp protease adaptor protein ClpS
VYNMTGMSDKDKDDVKTPDDPKEGIDLLERPATKIKKPSMYHVVLLNDDFTPMDFVVFILQKIFHKSLQDANLIMLEVHKKGKGIAGTYTYEVAEMKAIETLEAAKREQHPLQAVVERA